MSLFSMFATLGLDSSGYDKGLDEAEDKANGFGSKLKNGLSSAVKAVGTAVTAASAAVSAFGVASLKTGMEFDSSMSQIAATLGITTSDIENNVNGAGDTFDALRKKAQEMGAATNFSASQAAEGLNILAMSGFSASDSIEMVEDVLHLAAAGSMDMASAAGYVAGALKGFGGSAEDAGYYADLMAKGATLANTSVSQLGEAMSSGAAGAAAYGQEADSMTLALLRLAEQGDVGAAAGTALSAAMKNLYTPTDQAKKAMEELGVSAYTADGKARDFNDVVNDLSKSMEGMTAEEQANYKSTIFGIQGLDAYNKMTVTGIERQNEWADALAHASDGMGETAKQYETMTDNLQGDLDILSSAFDGLKIAVSDTLMDSAREFVQFGSDALSAITAGFQEGGIAGAMEALGGVISDGLVMLFDMLPDIVDAGMQLLNALISGIVDNAPVLIQSALDVITLLATTLAENPGTLIDAAVSIIDALTTWLGEYSYVLIDAAVQIIVKLAEALTNPDNIGTIIEGGIFLLLSLVDGLLDAIPQLISAVPVIITNLVTAISNELPAIIQAGFELLEMLVQGIMDNMPLVVDAVMTIIESITGFITENLPEILSMGMTLLMSLVKGILDNLPELVDAALTILTAVLDFFTENLPMLIDMGMELLLSLVQGLLDNMPTIIEAVTTIIEALLSWITENLPSIMLMGIELISTLAQGVLDNLPAIISAISDIIGALIGWVVDNLPMIIDTGIELIQTLAQGLLDNLPAIIDAITEIIFALIDWVTDNLDLVIDAGVELLMALIDGLIDSLPDLIVAALDIMMALVDGLIDNLPLLVEAAIEMMIQLAVGLVAAIPQIIARIPEIITGIVDAFINYDWSGLGGDIINGIKDGILNIGSTLWEGVKSVGQGLIDGFKGLFGIASPSKLMRDQVGKMIGEGLAEGIDQSAKEAVKSAEEMAEDVISEMDALNGMNTDFTANMTSGFSGASALANGGTVYINVYGAEGQSVEELADIISKKIAFGYRQEQAVWA